MPSLGQILVLNIKSKPNKLSFQVRDVIIVKADLQIFLLISYRSLLLTDVSFFLELTSHKWILSILTVPVNISCSCYYV